MNSYVVSCCTCFRTASYASATSASWPTGVVPLCCLFALPCSARHRKQGKPLQALRTPLIFGSAPSVLDRWWSSRESRLPKYNFVLHRWSPLPHETTLSTNKILRASPRSVVVRLIAEQICSSRFLSGLLCHICSQKLRSQRAERSTVLRATVPAPPDANPSLHSICIGPASAARAASFKRLNRTRAEHRACLHAFAKTRVRLSTSVTGNLKIYFTDYGCGEVWIRSCFAAPIHALRHGCRFSEPIVNRCIGATAARVPQRQRL